MNIRLVGHVGSPAFVFGSLRENAVMDAFAWVQCVLHQQVCVVLCLQCTRQFMCTCTWSYVCSRFEAVFMLSFD